MEYSPSRGAVYLKKVSELLPGDLVFRKPDTPDKVLSGQNPSWIVEKIVPTNGLEGHYDVTYSYYPPYVREVEKDWREKNLGLDLSHYNRKFTTIWSFPLNHLAMLRPKAVEPLDESIKDAFL